MSAQIFLTPSINMKHKILLNAALILILIVVGMVVFTYLKSTESFTDQTTEELVFDRPEFVPSVDEARPTIPIPGSVPEGANIPHSIPLEEITRTCARRDCLASIDAPTFVAANELAEVLATSSQGILFTYEGETRFYPFPVLEAHGIVNDVVGDTPVLVTYYPLRKDWNVFLRTLEGESVEFGISGMLWQSHLLMYNRAETLDDQNLWSQAMGQAVVGARTGQELIVLPSEIIEFRSWLTTNPEGQTLTSDVLNIIERAN